MSALDKPVRVDDADSATWRVAIVRPRDVLAAMLADPEVRALLDEHVWVPWAYQPNADPVCVHPADVLARLLEEQA